MLGYVRFASDNFEGCVKASKEALAIYHELQLKSLEAYEAFMLAQYFIARARTNEALPMAQLALSLFKETGGEPVWTPQAYGQVIECLVMSGSQHEAVQYAKECNKSPCMDWLCFVSLDVLDWLCYVIPDWL